MPRIRRWFHVSHDINSDPEVWEMRHRFGERTLGVWLEILSIADRYDGCLPDSSGELLRCLANKCRVTLETVQKVFAYAEQRLWIVSGEVRRVRNYTKYRPTRGDKQVPQRETLSTPSSPHTPTQHSTKTPVAPKDSFNAALADSTRFIASCVIGYLNEKTKKNFRVSGDKSLRPVIARINEGFTLEDMKRVIDLKSDEWGNSAKMFKFLRPSTLFGSEFESYLQEGVDPDE